jgi:hypothetical protein
MNSTQVLSNKRFGKLARGVLFESPNFVNQFELNHFSPT